MAGRDDNPGRGDPHHPQFDELKIKVFDAVMDFIVALTGRVSLDDGDDAEPAGEINQGNS